MIRHYVVTVLMLMFLFSCGSNGSGNQPYTEKRSNVKATPVQVYEEKGTGADSGTLKVELYETEVALDYRMISTFRGQTWEYLLTYPNFQIMPKPVLRNANAPMTVDVGFLDAEDEFHAFRLVKIVNGNMVFKRLKEYQVTPQ